MLGIIVFHGSTRKDSNTAYLTYRAVPKSEATHIHLRDYQVHPIVDERHSEQGFKPIDDDHKILIDQLLAHDTVVFSTPIYWYGMAGPLKQFIDRWSQIMRDPDYQHFREEMKKKKVYAIIVGGDSPEIKGLPLIQQFQYICQFFGMTFAGYLIGKASKPGEMKKNEEALAKAAFLLKKE